MIIFIDNYCGTKGAMYLKKKNHNSLKHINKDEGVVKLNSLDKVE